jgi:hypothetical protein
MKTIVALMKKDIVTFRPLLVAWGICAGINGLHILGWLFSSLFALRIRNAFLAFPQASGGADVHAFAQQWAVGMGFAFMFLSLSVLALLCGYVIFLILTIRAIHSDSLTERDAFWRTRPIPRRLLLAEKAILVGLLFLVTAAAAWMFHSGESWSAHGLRLLNAGALVSGVVAIACVTRNLSQLILTALGYAVGAQLLAGVVGALGHAILGKSVGFLPLIPGGEFGASVIYLVGFSAVIVNQYLTLKLNLSRLVLFGTFALVALGRGL